MKRLTTESSLKPLVAQFVPIKIDVASDDYKIWRRQHKPKKGAIPQLYIIRADGEELFNTVGLEELKNDRLPAVLKTAIGQSGYILSDAELNKVQTVVKVSNQQISAGDVGLAIKSVSQIPGGMNMTVACYAEPVIELRQNVQKLVESAQSDINSIKNEIANQSDDIESSIRLATRIVEMNRDLGRFKPVSKDLTALNRSVSKQSDLQTIVKDVKKFQSLKKSRSPNLTKLAELKGTYANTSLGREVDVVLKSSTKKANNAWSGFSKAESRSWTSKGGGFSIIAEPISVSDDKIKLKTSAGKVITVKIPELSKADQDWIRENRK